MHLTSCTSAPLLCNLLSQPASETIGWADSMMRKLASKTLVTSLVACMQVGVMHTNYLDYARREDNGNVKELLLK